MDNINPKTIDRILATGSVPLLQDLISLFKSVVPDALSLLEKAISSNDYEEVFQQAHRLKSSSFTIGADEMAHTCERLEAIGKLGGAAGQANALVLDIDEAYRNAMISLEQVVTSSSDK